MTPEFSAKDHLIIAPNDVQVRAQVVSQVVRRAADFIEQYGWTQNRYGSEATGLCLVGALRRATDSELAPSVTLRSLTAQFSRFLGFGEEVWHLTEWNDKLGRTKEEVITKLREFANSLENAEEERDGPGQMNNDEEDR